ncbi:MAG TPA: hypothetical protein VEG84_09845, partial [Thermoanaerobaculia bacterium]|nr:hypothetical protein [Thermoanaerobaculia bacterium]
MKSPLSQSVAIAAALLSGVAYGGELKASSEKGKDVQYNVSFLPENTGTASRGNSINDRGWVAGYSNLSGNTTRHATLWRDGLLFDLETLGGLNSN